MLVIRFVRRRSYLFVRVTVGGVRCTSDCSVGVRISGGLVWQSEKQCFVGRGSEKVNQYLAQIRKDLESLYARQQSLSANELLLKYKGRSVVRGGGEKKSRGVPYRYLSDSELAQIETYQFEKKEDNETKDVFLFLCYSGLNFSELVSMNFDVGKQCKKINNVLCIVKPRNKTQQFMFVPLSEKAKKILEKYGFVLPNVNRRRIDYLTVKLRKALSLEWFSLKTARKTAGANWLQKGMNINVVAVMLGHESTKTTLKYYVKLKAENVITEWLNNGFE